MSQSAVSQACSNSQLGYTKAISTPSHTFFDDVFRLEKDAYLTIRFLRACNVSSLDKKMMINEINHLASWAPPHRRRR